MPPLTDSEDSESTETDDTSSEDESSRSKDSIYLATSVANYRRRALIGLPENTFTKTSEPTVSKKKNSGKTDRKDASLKNLQNIITERLKEDERNVKANNNKRSTLSEQKRTSDIWKELLKEGEGDLVA